MKRKTPTVFNVGISSILIIFILLSLVSFATLALITARADYSLSQKYADRVRTYYAAQNEAIQKWNDLNRSPQGEKVSYQVPIGESQRLNVSLVFSEEEQTYHAACWKTENIQEWVTDDTLHLYTGETQETP